MSGGEESTPLIWEDDVVARQGACRRRAVCVATVCLSLGLCVAIIVPVTLTTLPTGGTDLKQETAFVKSQSFNQLQKSTLMSADKNTIRNGSKSTQASITTKTSMATKSSMTTNASTTTKTSMTTNAIMRTKISMTTNASTTTKTLMKMSTSNRDLSSRDVTMVTSPATPSACPKIPDSEHGTINLEYLNKTDQVWYELYRIQTRNSAAYVEGISCSIMQLNFSSGHPMNGTVSLSWEEGRYFRRQRKSVTLELLEARPPSEWTEDDNSNHTAMLSLVTYLNGYLLTYECFPEARSRRQPAYIIHIYSQSPHGHISIITQALLALADIWGLNPAQEKATFIRQQFCDLNIGQP